LEPAAEVRSYIPEKKAKGRRDWQGQHAEQQAVYENRRRVRGEYGKSLLRRRGELIERSFAHCYETGGHAALPFTKAGEHSEAAAGPRRGVQLEPDSAQAAGSGYAARAEKPRWASIFSTFGLSMPDDGRFPHLATHSPDWPADGTIFPVPDTSSPFTHFP
jgi:hypothetical protein